jgi:hypothetical protein
MHMTSDLNPIGEIHVTTHAQFQRMKAIQFQQLLVDGTENN